MVRKKVLGFWDLMLFTFCAIFGVEAIATSAAIGPSAISWWLICIVGYFLPYGLITAELGSTYPEQGGIYVWIKRALGEKWAARSIWYYWIALPLWLPAMYIAIANIIGHMFFPDISLWPQVLIGIIMIWFAVGINLFPLKFSKWIPNIGSFTRIFVIFGMIAAAIIYFVKNGRFANEINLANMLPNLDAAIVFIPVILYNLEGCELVSGAAGEMKNPARDVPKAIILSAIVIAALYLITTFAVWVVIPINEINVASGILQIFAIAFSGQEISYIITIIFGLLISITLFAEIVTWNLGENRVVAEAANSGQLPKVLGKMNKNMAPIGASVISGAISTVVIVIYGFIARDASELFWHVISFSLSMGLFSYLILFPVFIILRKRDKNIKRPYRVPGPDWFAIILAVMAEMFVLIAVLVLIIQPGHDFIRSALPVIIGVLITVIAGEILLSYSRKKSRG
ncbi:MAG: APC family permease [Candidatus Omnitrophica bacterium]|nr:APC family permease [Candidatus Omnitrophota bacterium]MDD5661174.1 APC family permease [Candidatus Omnitrophota bacterium]